MIDESVMVTEKEIRKAMILYMKHEHQLLEGAAGVAVAAMLQKKQNLKEKKVGVVICGGNFNLNTLKGLL
tara:strand:- start:982 stop:1191 length:210 start_codon:yes stop_codon:yes gene_type:complete